MVRRAWEWWGELGGGGEGLGVVGRALERRGGLWSGEKDLGGVSSAWEWWKGMGSGGEGFGEARRAW